MKNKRTIIISVVASIALLALIIGATFAYFQATGENSQSTDIKVTTYTTDLLTFEIGNDISIYADQTSFGVGKGNATGTTFAKATLIANNKTNTATDKFSIYLNIPENTFTYSIDENTPELLLTITDASGNAVTDITSLTYKTVTDGNGASISGYDITTKTGLLTLNTIGIIGNPTKIEQWNITITLVNYNADQTANAGKNFNAQLIMNKEDLRGYTLNTINTINTTQNENNLTVNLNMDSGTFEISKYYYAIEEVNDLAIANTKSTITKLNNTLASNDLIYVESNESSYTFSNIKSNTKYKIYAYAVDDKNIKTNIYKYVYINNYSLPIIESAEVKGGGLKINAIKGTSEISKYYYSVDGGGTFVESTSSSYYLDDLGRDWYNFCFYVEDVNGNKSNIYIKREYYENSGLPDGTISLHPYRGTITTTAKKENIELNNYEDISKYVRVYNSNLDGETIDGWTLLYVVDVVFFNATNGEVVLYVPGGYIKVGESMLVRTLVNGAWLDVEAETIGDNELKVSLTKTGPLEILILNE